MRGVILLLIIAAVLADVPVHCPDTVSGEWRFFVGSEGQQKNIDCKTFTPVNMFNVFLKLPNEVYEDAELKKKIGTYTMVADEGIELFMRQRVYYAFFYYGTNASCDVTANGWAHESARPENWSCFMASRVKTNELEAPHHPHHPHRHNMGIHSHAEGEKVENDAVYALGEQVCAAIRQAGADWECDPYSELYAKYTVHAMKHRLGARNHHGPRFPFEHKFGMGKFKGHRRFADYPKSSASGRAYTAEEQRILATLPSDFDWRNVGGVNYVSPIRDQEYCGSCYSFSATGSLESRIRVESKNKYQPILSPEDIVACDDKYAQGCGGGFAYLGGKYMQDFTIVEESCFPYKAGSGTPSQCSQRCTNGTRWRAVDHGYVGGYLGASNEANMMQEIYDHGPISVSVLMGGDLLHYKSGIYSPIDLPADVTQKLGWEKTNHAVVVVGWGYDTAKARKYWIVRNSWGTGWGDKGYFLVDRGTDASHIECCAVYIRPAPAPTN